VREGEGRCEGRGAKRSSSSSSSSSSQCSSSAPRACRWQGPAGGPTQRRGRAGPRQSQPWLGSGAPLGAAPHLAQHKVGEEEQLLADGQHQWAQRGDVGLERLARHRHELLAQLDPHHALLVCALVDALERLLVGAQVRAHQVLQLVLGAPGRWGRRAGVEGAGPARRRVSGAARGGSGITPVARARASAAGRAASRRAAGGQPGAAAAAHQPSRRLLLSSTADPPARNRQLGSSIDLLFPKYQLRVMFSVLTWLGAGAGAGSGGGLGVSEPRLLRGATCSWHALDC
jgi:hypothetical protein